MKTLRVELGQRGYPIHIGRRLLQQASLFSPHIGGTQVMIVTNATVAPLYLDALRDSLQGYLLQSVILPDGEEHKNLTVLDAIFDALLEARFDRGCTLIALGGGVVGDMTGFAAATYQRGVSLVQVPTTLLAQVDSSVGGKTGVNHPLGKNMIGAFYQPRLVVADTDTLDTLDDRQLSAGIAEIIKYGLIRDPEFFAWLEAHMEALMERSPEHLAYAIERSCWNKAQVVAADERESGERALLNLGHTFGHAIETGLGYGSWLHGEAVAAGMAMAADLSHRMGWLCVEDVARIRTLLDRARLPTAGPAQLDADGFLSRMAVDKKVHEGTLRLVLLRSIGMAVVTSAAPPAQLRQTLTECRASLC